jgi:hypothetical protein
MYDSIDFIAKELSQEIDYQQAKAEFYLLEEEPDHLELEVVFRTIEECIEALRNINFFLSMGLIELELVTLH